MKDVAEHTVLNHAQLSALLTNEDSAVGGNSHRRRVGETADLRFKEACRQRCSLNRKTESTETKTEFKKDRPGDASWRHAIRLV